MKLRFQIKVKVDVVQISFKILSCSSLVTALKKKEFWMGIEPLTSHTRAGTLSTEQ